MKKDLRRQIKEDELVSGFARTAAWIRGHKDESRVTTLAVLVIAAGAWGLAFFQAHRTRESEGAFAEALEVFQTPIENELPQGSERPPGPVFASTKEKFTKAAAAFDGVERRFSSLPAGLRARYYGALCRIELGAQGEGEKALAEIASRKELQSLEPTLARLALADLHKRNGQVDQAVEAYRQMVEDASLPIPRDHALMSLASTLEEARRLPEARASYRRLADEFPGSVYATEARRRADYLETAAGG